MTNILGAIGMGLPFIVDGLLASSRLEAAHNATDDVMQQATGLHVKRPVATNCAVQIDINHRSLGELFLILLKQ